MTEIKLCLNFYNTYRRNNLQTNHTEQFISLIIGVLTKFPMAKYYH